MRVRNICSSARADTVDAVTAVTTLEGARGQKTGCFDLIMSLTARKNYGQGNQRSGENCEYIETVKPCASQIEDHV